MFPLPLGKSSSPDNTLTLDTSTDPTDQSEYIASGVGQYSLAELPKQIVKLFVQHIDSASTFALVVKSAKGSPIAMKVDIYSARTYMY